MQTITAQFISKVGFATGLTPKLKITSLEDNSVTDVVMQEVWNWNYKYDMASYNPYAIYFFNFDADDDTIINRYQWSNNNDVRVLYSMGGWSTIAEDTKKKEKELIEKIAKEVMDKMKEYIDKKHRETLDSIVSNTQTSDVEIDYGIIDHSIEKNTLEIVQKINNIKIPKYDDSKIKQMIEKSIMLIKDTSKLEDISKNIQTIKDELKDEIKERTKWEINDKDIKKIIEQALDSDDDFKVLLLSQDKDFIKLTSQNG